MTFNELVGKIAHRAGELEKMPRVQLILLHPDNLDGTKSGAQWQGVTRAQCIESILYEEFEYQGEDFEIEEPK